MRSLEQRLDKVEGIIKKPSFRQNKGLGNEVGYYIFDYPAEQELAIREYVEYIHLRNCSSKLALQSNSLWNLFTLIAHTGRYAR